MRAIILTTCLTAAVAGCESNNRSMSDSSRSGDSSGAYDSRMEGRTDSGTREFLREATLANRAEVNLGRLALQRASDPRVRTFGQHMIDDHRRADDELARIVREQSLSMPTAEPDQNMEDRLSGLSGAAFDREYITAMVRDHEKAVRLFERQARNGQNAALRDFAERTLPTLREHLRMARDIGQSVGTGMSMPRDSSLDTRDTSSMTGP